MPVYMEKQVILIFQLQHTDDYSRLPVQVGEVLLVMLLIVVPLFLIMVDILLQQVNLVREFMVRQVVGLGLEFLVRQLVLMVMVYLV